MKRQLSTASMVPSCLLLLSFQAADLTAARAADAVVTADEATTPKKRSRCRRSW